LPFSCTHLALWRGKVPKNPRYVNAKQKGFKNFFILFSLHKSMYLIYIFYSFQIFDEFRPSRNYSINQNHIALGGLESNQSKAFGERPSTFDNHFDMNFMKKCHESRLQSKLKNPDFDAIVTTNSEMAPELPENYLQKRYTKYVLIRNDN
jgi:hypothetical protein